MSATKFHTHKKHPQLPFLPQCHRPSFTPIKNTLSFLSSLNVTDQVSHPYKTPSASFQRYIVITLVTSSCSKYPVIFVKFYYNFSFLDLFPKKYSNILFHKFLSCGIRVFSMRPGGRTSGRTGVTKVILAFHNFLFANSPKNTPSL